MSDTEQLYYGREGIERGMDYVPMPAPTNDEPAPELEREEAIKDRADELAGQARPTIERQYFDEENKPQPQNKTVELDRAARDLAENRIAEEAIAELDRNAAVAAEIDAARRWGQGESRLAQEAQQPEALQQQPQTDQQKYDAALEALYAQQTNNNDLGADPELQRALQNPKVLHAIAQERSADAAKVDAAVNQAAQWAQENAAVAMAAIIARPELQGVPPGQYAGALQALKVSNPAAHAEIARQIANTQAVLQQAKQVEQQQLQRYATAFQQWSNAQDDVFEKSVAAEPPETVRALREHAHQMFRDAGFTDEQVSYHWQTNSLMRSAIGQQIIADAARYRMLKAGIKPAPKSVPQVSRPGSSMDRPVAADRGAFELENRYRGPLSAKQAAELVIGRRARASR